MCQFADMSFWLNHVWRLMPITHLTQNSKRTFFKFPPCQPVWCWSWTNFLSSASLSRNHIVRICQLWFTYVGLRYFRHRVSREEVNQRSLVTLSQLMYCPKELPLSPSPSLSVSHNGSALVGSGRLQITAGFVRAILSRYILYHSDRVRLFVHSDHLHAFPSYVRELIRLVSRKSVWFLSPHIMHIKTIIQRLQM